MVNKSICVFVLYLILPKCSSSITLLFFLIVVGFFHGFIHPPIFLTYVNARPIEDESLKNNQLKDSVFQDKAGRIIA